MTRDNFNTMTIKVQEPSIEGVQDMASGFNPKVMECDAWDPCHGLCEFIWMMDCLLRGTRT